MRRSFGVASTETLAASATSANVLQGTRFQPMIEDGFVSLWATSSVAGTLVNFKAQSDDIATEYEISDANRYPVMDEDWVFLTIPVAKGDVLNLKFTDGGGAGASVVYKVSFTPRGTNFGIGRRV